MTNHEDQTHSSEYDQKQFLDHCDKSEDIILEKIIKKAKELGLLEE